MGWIVSVHFHPNTHTHTHPQDSVLVGCDGRIRANDGLLDESKSRPALIHQSRPSGRRQMVALVCPGGSECRQAQQTHHGRGRWHRARWRGETTRSGVDPLVPFFFLLTQTIKLIISSSCLPFPPQGREIKALDKSPCPPKPMLTIKSRCTKTPGTSECVVSFPSSIFLDPRTLKPY